MATYCPQCGQPNPESSLDCSNCGYDLHQPPPPPPAAAPKKQRSDEQKEADQTLLTAILVTLLCCMPTGLFAILFAARARVHVRNGEIERAREATRFAVVWNWISFGLGLGTILFIVFGAVLEEITGGP